MVPASHPPVTQVMTKGPGELLHMDTVGPARVRSEGGKWYVLVIVDDFSRYSWVFFMEGKDEAFSHVRDLILRLQTELPKNAMRAICIENGILGKLILQPKNQISSMSESLILHLHEEHL